MRIGHHTVATAFRLHRSVLSAKSDGIKQLIEANTNESFTTLNISGTALSTFDLFVRWAYSDEPPTNGVNTDEWKETGTSNNIITHYGLDFQGYVHKKNNPGNSWFQKLQR